MITLVGKSWLSRRNLSFLVNVFKFKTHWDQSVCCRVRTKSIKFDREFGLQTILLVYENALMALQLEYLEN